MPEHDSDTTNPNKRSRKNPATDAIHMLKEDHRTVAALFDQLLTGESIKRSRIAELIFHDLEVHSTLEEELFYPALQTPSGIEACAAADEGKDLNRDKPMHTSELEETDEMIAEHGEENDGSEEMINNLIMAAFGEHRVIRDLIAQLRQKDALSDEFQQGMMELQQTVANHVVEEEDELFAEAQLIINTTALGKRIQQRKQELLSPTV